MVAPVAVVAARERGQVIAEFAIVLPAVTLLILGSIQAGLLGYASLVARHAAFRGLRAAMVAKPLERDRAAKLAAALTVAAAPGLSLARIEVHEPLYRFPGGAVPVRRLAVCVRVGAPRLVPLRYAWAAEAQAVLPMEPSW
jgi:hypothetical protein